MIKPCKNLCKHLICSRMCKECKLDIFNAFIGKNISGLICKDFKTPFILKAAKVFEDEEWGNLCKVSEDSTHIYAFLLNGTDDAIMGFCAALWEVYGSIFPQEMDKKLIERSMYEMNYYTEEELSFYKSLNKTDVLTRNLDGYDTNWFVDTPEEFAAGYFLGASIYLIDSDLAANVSMNKNVYSCEDTLIKPDYTSLDLCVHQKLKIYRK